MPYFDQAGDRTTKKQMTDTALATLQANVADYAQEQSWTKQQTIAFTILAIFEQGYGIGRAVDRLWCDLAIRAISLAVEPIRMATV